MNIKKIYGFQFFWIFAVVLPILYPYYSSLGISTHEFFQLQAVFGLTAALFEIPTGYFSDSYGRKKSLCLGALISGLSYWILTQATGFWGILAHEFTLGLALSFVSGTDVAILFESLPRNFSRDLSSRILSHNQMASALGEFSAALICSALLTFISYKELIAIQAVLAWFPLLVALTLREPKVHQSTHLDFKKIKKLWWQLLHEHSFLRLLTFNFVVWLLATYIAVWIVQRYWQEQQVPLVWFGVLWASCNLTIGLTGLFSRSLENSLGMGKSLLLVGVLCTGAYFLMPLVGGLIGVLCGFLIYVARGLNNVISRDLLNQSMDPALRATANSILNFLFRLAFAIVGPAVGFSIDKWGLNTTLLSLGIFFLMCLVFITAPLLRGLTSKHSWENLVSND
jgi:MFS family permease